MRHRHWAATTWSGRCYGKRSNEYVDDGYKENSEDRIVVKLNGVDVRPVLTTNGSTTVHAFFENEHRSHYNLQIMNMVLNYTDRYDFC